MRKISAEQMRVLRKLFPEGISAVRVWNEIVIPLKQKCHGHLSIERLEGVLVRRLKLKGRILKYFPGDSAQLKIIFLGDMNLLLKITQDTWSFEDSHKPYSRHIVVLHGMTPRQALLDWAAQAIITMLILYIDAEL